MPALDLLKAPVLLAAATERTPAPAFLSPLVVTAAGALQTPPLLRRSGLGGHPRARSMTAVQAMGRILFAAGALEVLTGIPRAPRARTLPELDVLLTGITPRDLHLSAFHPAGTVAAGSDPERASADGEGRLRGVDGVLVTDASVLPGCPEVNPQLSIMAAALAVTETYLEREPSSRASTSA